MAGPWEKYQTGGKPWEKYRQAAAPSQPAQLDVPPIPEPFVRGIEPARPAPPLAGMGPGGADVLAADQPEFFARQEQAGPEQNTLASRAGEFGFGANEGIAAIAGLPVDAMNNAPRLLNLLPGEQGIEPISSDPVGGRESILHGIEALGLRGSEPTDATGRVIARTGQEIGATALPAAGLMRLAQRAAPAAGAVGKDLERLLVEPFRQAPGRTAAVEGALAAAAGGGAGVNNEVGIDPSALPFVGGALPGPDLTGALTGSFGLGGAMRAARLAGDVFNTVMNPQGVSAGVRQAEVGRTLLSNATSPDALVPNINRGIDTQAAVPGMRMTTGAASADPGIQALEFSRRNAKNAGEFRRVDTSNNQAANQALDTVAPAQADDAATRARLNARSSRAIGAAKAGTQRRQQSLDQSLTKTDPQQTQQSAGRQVRGGVEAQRESLVAQRKGRSDPALQEALSSDARVDSSGVIAQIDAKLAVDKREPVVNALKSVRAKMFKNAPDAEGNPVIDDTVSGLYETRKVVNDLIAGRGETSTGRFAQKELKEVRDVLDEALIAAEPRFGEFLTEFRAGSQPINRLDEGATGAVLKADKLTGTPALPSSEVPAQFFKAGKGSPEAIQEFIAKVGSRQEAVTGLRDFAMTDARKAFEAQGEKGLRTWLTKHQDALKAFPELRRDLSNAADLKATLDRSTRREKLLRERLSNPRKSTIARYLDSEDARTSMQGVLNAKRPAEEMENLTRLIRGDKDALEGAKRGFWDGFVQRNPSKPAGAAQSRTEDLVNTPFLSPGKLKQYIRKNNAALEVLYKDDPAQLQRIRDIADAVSQGQQSSKARPPGQSGTALAQRNLSVPGLTVAGLASRSYAYVRGVVSLPYLVTETGLRLGRRAVVRVRKDQFEDLLDRALMDPEVAKTMVMKANADNANVIKRRIRLHLGSEASNALQTDENQ
jgi:hypothetical protein